MTASIAQLLVETTARLMAGDAASMEGSGDCANWKPGPFLVQARRIVAAIFGPPCEAFQPPQQPTYINYSTSILAASKSLAQCRPGDECALCRWPLSGHTEGSK